ncbi:MAG TPA: VOC family protein [Microbacterium sp.]|uniref:VOC family protein n=1 Tax=Microbacterium sp. TaxID=51671 RepID=UPI002C69A0B3|nr:VOC family protein [Microbacterium sp.]HWI31802.1 VOC family protein [Microbacterium sp.]
MTADPVAPRHVLAHLGPHAILTPTIDETLAYFVDLLGMDIVHESDDGYYLRAFGDYERWSLHLIRADRAGLGYASWRMVSPEALDERVQWLEANGYGGHWTEPELGIGRFYEFLDPDGHAFRLYYDTERYVAPEDKRPVIPTNFQSYVGRGANVRHVDHLNLLARDVRACREFWEAGFGLRTYEIIRLPDESEAGAWMSSSIQGHELIYTQEKTSGSGRLHHFAYLVDTREEVLRAAEIFTDARIYIEAGPSRHTAIQGFYLYTREPGGNRIEVANGGYLVFAPDPKPYIWTAAEWAKKPGWGAPIPPEFHIYGTPVVDE